MEQQIGWDFEDESPGRDARGFAREGSLVAPMVETHLAKQGAHQRGAPLRGSRPPRILSSPECLTPLNA